MAGRRKRKATDKPRGITAKAIADANKNQLTALRRMASARMALENELRRQGIGGGNLLRRARFARTKKGRLLFGRAAQVFKVAKTGNERRG